MVISLFWNVTWRLSTRSKGIQQYFLKHFINIRAIKLWIFSGGLTLLSKLKTLQKFIFISTNNLIEYALPNYRMVVWVAENADAQVDIFFWHHLVVLHQQFPKYIYHTKGVYWIYLTATIGNLTLKVVSECTDHRQSKNSSCSVFWPFRVIRHKIYLGRRALFRESKIAWKC